jgi:hypothetical protein
LVWDANEVTGSSPTRYTVTVQRILAIMAFMTSGVLTGSGAHAGLDDLPTFPGLGQYANLFAGICGKNKVDKNPASLPDIGCFAIKAGAALK